MLVLAREVLTILPAEGVTYEEEVIYEENSTDASYSAESNTLWYSLIALFSVSVIVLAIKNLKKRFTY